MDHKLIIFVLTGAFFSVAFSQTRQYYFVSTSVTWTEAQSHCRDVYTDLATIENTADLNAVRTIAMNTGKAWIGLYVDLENSWRWSLNNSSFYGDRETTFRNWSTNQPNNFNGQQRCVALLSGSPYNGTWDDRSCTETKYFVCYNGTLNGKASFVRVNISMNWTEAQSFCQKTYVDLASIRNQTENEAIRVLADGNDVWIGLYRQESWSDGSSSLFRHWAAGQPNSGEQQCIAADFADSGQWSAEKCCTNYPFICFTTIPLNGGSFLPVARNESSITLQWAE